MAVTVLTPVKGDFNAITEYAFTTATTPADGFEFTMPKTTEEYVSIQVNATAAGDIAVKAPNNGGYAAADADLEHTLAKDEFAVIRIESARYADNKGKVKLVPSDAGITVAVLY